MGPGRPSARRANTRSSCRADRLWQPSSPPRSLAAQAAQPQHSEGRGHNKYSDDPSQHAKAEVLQSPADLRPALEHLSFVLPGVEDLPDVSPSVTRRSALVAACGAGALWWLNALPSAPLNRAIESAAITVPLADAEATCMEAGAVCSTVHSQMSSTLRQLSAGFLSPELFQATCERRLGAPFFLETVTALQDAVPVIGNELAYAPDLSGTGWLAATLGHPRVDAAIRERFEVLTLSTLQRARRVSRLAAAMQARKYTPAGVQLLVQDVRFLATSLDELALAVAERRAAQH